MTSQTGLEGHLSNILETVAEGIALINGEGVYTFVNAAAERLFGVPRDVIMGRHYDDPVWEFTGPGGEPLPLEEMPPWKVMRLREPVLDAVIGASLPDGRRVRLSINAVPFFDDRRQFLGTLLSFNDITRRERVERLDKALAGISSSVNSTFDFDEIMQRALDLAVDALGCEGAILFIAEDSDWVMRYLCNFPEDMKGTRVPEADASFTLLSGGQAGALAFNDAYRDDRISNRLMRRFKIKSLLDVTLRVRGRDIADVSFVNHRVAAPFDQDDVDFADKFGALVGLALENSQLYRSEQETARLLQVALQGSPADVEGVKASKAYRSGTKTASVGGDFYDLFAVSEDRVAVLLGDVSGKGLPKATIAAMAKYTMIAYLLEGESPAKVLARTNNIIAQSTDDATFITAVVGVLDRREGRFTYSNAGHPDPLLLHEDGRVERLPVRSALAGAFLDTGFVEDQVQVEPCDRLVLYSDGVTEARSSAGFFGEQRTEDLVRDRSSVEIGQIAGALLEGVSDFAQGELNDDVAILVLQAGQ